MYPTTGKWPNDRCVSLVKVVALCYGLLSLLLVGASTSTTSHKNRIYLIRHAEKPADGSRGLTPKGRLRAKCLKELFGTKSRYNIGYIITPDFKRKIHRAYETVLPLANHLGIEIDRHCGRKDPACVAATVNETLSDSKFKGDVLVSWRHSGMKTIARLLGLEKEAIPPWPGKRFDLIWTVEPDDNLLLVQEQNCPHLKFLDDDGLYLNAPSMVVQDWEHMDHRNLPDDD